MISPERLADQQLTLSMEECDWLSIVLSDRVEDICQRTGQQYDLLAVIPRGSFGPGNVLSHRLGFDALSIISASITSYSDDAHEAGKIATGQLPTADLVEGKDVLIVDDTSDTDRTFEEFRRIAFDLGARSVDGAVMVYKPGRNQTGIAPRYFALQYNGWINFDWERHNKVGESSVVRRKSAPVNN